MTEVAIIADKLSLLFFE